MKWFFAIAIALLATGCASTSMPLTGVILHDYEAAQHNFEAAAKQAAPGSVSQRKLQAAAECMQENVARLSAGNLQATDKEIAGLISAGSAAYIDILLLEERAATRAAGSEACDQLTGQIVRGVGSKALRVLPTQVLN